MDNWQQKANNRIKRPIIDSYWIQTTFSRHWTTQYIRQCQGLPSPAKYQTSKGHMTAFCLLNPLNKAIDILPNIDKRVKIELIRNKAKLVKRWG